MVLFRREKSFSRLDSGSIGEPDVEGHSANPHEAKHVNFDATQRAAGQRDTAFFDAQPTHMAKGPPDMEQGLLYSEKCFLRQSLTAAHEVWGSLTEPSSIRGVVLELVGAWLCSTSGENELKFAVVTRLDILAVWIEALGEVIPSILAAAAHEALYKEERLMYILAHLVQDVCGCGEEMILGSWMNLASEYRRVFTCLIDLIHSVFGYLNHSHRPVDNHTRLFEAVFSSARSTEDETPSICRFSHRIRTVGLSLLPFSCSAEVLAGLWQTYSFAKRIVDRLPAAKSLLRTVLITWVEPEVSAGIRVYAERLVALQNPTHPLSQNLSHVEFLLLLGGRGLPYVIRCAPVEEDLKRIVAAYKNIQLITSNLATTEVEVLSRVLPALSADAALHVLWDRLWYPFVTAPFWQCLSVFAGLGASEHQSEAIVTFLEQFRVGGLAKTLHDVAATGEIETVDVAPINHQQIGSGVACGPSYPQTAAPLLFFYVYVSQALLQPHDRPTKTAFAVTPSAYHNALPSLAWWLLQATWRHQPRDDDDTGYG